MRSPAVAALVAGSALLSACGGEKPAPPPQSTRPDTVTVTPAADGGQSVEIDADDGFRFHPSTVRAEPGPITVTLRHVGRGAPHNWTIRQLPAAHTSLAAAGQSRSVRFTVSKPGDYRFVCTIHERQGQIGTLTVVAP
ncbi:MAG TPA: plastocyanin/azurin family copper-binding protein [Mycobacteriales bacterium]